ncbi:protein-disulfide isomerase [Hoeflea sp. IMCC20628]|uniref:DsbA family protein n=1 Tax=Hoeflea sp. IMCC20628 TaxID=1620421 RepID=UPI00063A8B57|nr:DsbA family protein [Hoeflea sp. IMCC20628]AKI00981.1 protein-disulfide isomerase [Hoeflea sp. IMCC20628]
MTFHPRKGLLAALLIGMSTALPLPAAALDDSQKKEFGAFIHEYLLANPEIIEEMSQALEIKKEAESRVMAQAAISSNEDAIFRAPEDIVLGNPDGDVTVVEFYDYNCSFCKRAMNDMVGLLEKDPNVRFVLKEFPILGPDSLAAHRVAMSFRKLAPEHYRDFHVALLGGDVRATEAHAIEVATGFGVDAAALKAGMDDPAIDQSIKQTYELANALGISGTPSFIIGDEAVFGAVGEETLQAKITNMRQCESTVC